MEANNKGYGTTYNNQRNNFRCKPSDFVYKSLTPDDYQMCVEFLNKHFFPQEPLCRGFNANVEDCHGIGDGIVNSSLNFGAAVCAIHVPTKNVVGISLTQILNKEDPVAFEMKQSTQYQESVQNITNVLKHLGDVVDLFEDAEITKVLEISATAVDSKFSGNKLVYGMTEKLEKKAVELGCQAIVSYSTNIRTQHMRKKMGFETLYTLDYNAMQEDGTALMDLNDMEGSSCAKVLRKMLKHK